MSGWQIFDYVYWTISIAANVVFTIVVTIGGFSDLRYLFRKLKEESSELED
jgi:tellurite resistance protein TehA-like permease